MALTKEEKLMVQEARDTARDLKIVIVGMDGDEGLCGRVDALIKSVSDLASSHSKLKRNFWILVAVLMVTGVIGSGIYGVLNGG